MQAQAQLIKALKAVESNDFNLFDKSKNKMGSYLPQLSVETKTIINCFLDKYEFEDDRL